MTLPLPLPGGGAGSLGPQVLQLLQPLPQLAEAERLRHDKRLKVSAT